MAASFCDPMMNSAPGRIGHRVKALATALMVPVDAGRPFRMCEIVACVLPERAASSAPVRPLAAHSRRSAGPSIVALKGESPADRSRARYLGLSCPPRGW